MPRQCTQVSTVIQTDLSQPRLLLGTRKSATKGVAGFVVTSNCSKTIINCSYSYQNKNNCRTICIPNKSYNNQNIISQYTPGPQRSRSLCDYAWRNNSFCIRLCEIYLKPRKNTSKHNVSSSEAPSLHYFHDHISRLWTVNVAVFLF